MLTAEKKKLPCENTSTVVLIGRRRPHAGQGEDLRWLATVPALELVYELHSPKARIRADFNRLYCGYVSLVNEIKNDHNLFTNV